MPRKKQKCKHWLEPLDREDRLKFLVLLVRTLADNPKALKLMKDDLSVMWKQALRACGREIKLPFLD